MTARRPQPFNGFSSLFHASALGACALGASALTLSLAPVAMAGSQPIVTAANAPAAVTTPTSSSASNDAPDAASERMVRLAQQLSATKAAPAGEPAVVAPASPSSAIAPSAQQAITPVTSSNAAPISQQGDASALPANERRALGAAANNSSNAISSSGKPDSAWLLNTLAALGAVIGLMLVLRAVVMRAVGKNAGTSRSPAVEVLSRSVVAPRSNVLLLRVGRRILVVGETPSGLRTLSDVSDPEEVASLLTLIEAAKPNSVTQTFAQALGQLNSEYTPEQRLIDEGGDENEHRIDRARDGVSGLLSKLRTSQRGSAYRGEVQP
jgi:flagellar biogenesis protein FliO